jgi:phosphoenolpyruvate phosphomutase
MVHSLRNLIETNRLVRVLEAHTPLCGLIAQAAEFRSATVTRKFDAVWSSSLSDSAIRGKPDIEVVDHSSRLLTLHELMDVCSLPVIYDCDTGGNHLQLRSTVRSLERAGVAAAIVEDKGGLKQNSLKGNMPGQRQVPIEDFCTKLQSAKTWQRDSDFMVIARIESLVLGNGMQDALTRAREYLRAGADGIMIHSHHQDPEEVLAFSHEFRRSGERAPLVAVPTTYNAVAEETLAQAGINVIIYANHLLRSSHNAMKRAANSILQHGRAAECEEICTPVSEILRCFDA